MSAALVDCLVSIDADDPPVAEWLADLPGESGHGVRTSSKPQLTVVCAAAVDPLEIAANLEAAGMTNALVRETSPHVDVFGLARQLWVDVGYEPVEVAPQEGRRSGNWRDLARGVLYAAPALLLYALIHALHVEVTWWTLPLGVTWGWAVGQVIAFTGFTLRGRGLVDAAARCGGWLLLWAPLSTAILGTAANATFGGGIASVAAATVLTTYMVAGAVLLLHKRELLAAWLLAPGALATAVALVVGSNPATDTFVVAAVLATVAATMIGAARHLRLGLRGGLGLGSADVATAIAHLIHGLLCGLALSLVAIAGAGVNEAGPNPAFAALPLLLTLGVMEWQLSTFNVRVRQLMSHHDSIERFKPAASRAFRRSFAIYVLACVAASLGVAVITRLDHRSPPTALLAAQVVLGAAYFLDLTIVSLGRLDRALACWLIGAGAGLTCAAWGRAASIEAGVLVWRSACAATVVVTAALLLRAHQVARSATSH